MTDSPSPTGDQKDIMIAGCHVQLTYGQAAGVGWTVSATIKCADGEQSLVTEAFESREAAEHEALEQVSALLGNNTDRNRSRVRNWN